MRHLHFLLTCIFMTIFVLTSCMSSNSDGPFESSRTMDRKVTETSNKIVILFPHGAAETSPTNATALKFKDLVEQRSNGRIIVDVYPDETLGNVAEISKALKSGTVQVTSGTINFMLSHLLACYNKPNQFADKQTAIAKLSSGPLREAVNAEYEKSGLKLLGVVPDSFRVTSSKKPIRSIEDFKGLKIRIMNDTFQSEYWKALGAQPMHLPFNEVYTALQQNLVEAQENPLATIVATKVYDHQKYIILTNHFMHYNAIFMNKAFFENLPAEYQTLIKEVMPEVMRFSFEYSNKAEEDARKRIIDAGLEIIELPAETHAAISKVTVPVLDAMVRSHAGNKFDEIIRAVNEE